MTTSKSITVCPNCNNPHIRLSSSLGGWLTQEEWICDKCGYQGVLVKEIDIEDLKTEDKK